MTEHRKNKRVGPSVQKMRRGMLSLMPFFFLPWKVKASLKPPRKNTPIKKEEKETKKEQSLSTLFLPKNPRPFQDIVEVPAGRIERLFSRKKIDPGTNKINGESGLVSVHHIYEGTQGRTVYLQFTGNDLGWIILS